MEIISQRLSLPARDASIDTRPRIEVRPARHEGALSFATISDLAGFEALGSEWRALFEASGQPQQVFQTFEWLAIWAPLYLDSRTRLSIVIGRIERSARLGLAPRGATHLRASHPIRHG